MTPNPIEFHEINTEATFFRFSQIREREEEKKIIKNQSDGITNLQGPSLSKAPFTNIVLVFSPASALPHGTHVRAGISAKKGRKK